MATRGGSKYPDADEIEMAVPDDSDPASEFAYGYIVQHNRLWLAFVVSVLINLLLAIAMIFTLQKGAPPISYVTLQGGLPVVVGDGGEVTVGGQEYNPARLRGVVKDYLENRFNYDWQNLSRVNDALRYLTADAAAKDRARLTVNFLQSKVIGPQVKVRLELDYAGMQVVAIKPGEFDVTVGGRLLYNDLATAPDINDPQERPVSFKLRVATVAPTDLNRDGYAITIIPEDIL